MATKNTEAEGEPGVEKRKKKKAQQAEDEEAPKSKKRARVEGGSEAVDHVSAADNTEETGKAKKEKASDSVKGQGRGRGKGKPVSAGRGDSSRPSALKMLRPKAGRSHTLSVALPASIIDNCQSFELKAVMVGQIARALTIYAVDEVVLYEDQVDAPKSKDSEGVSKGMAFFVRNLQYLETPQYLRRQLLPEHPDLKKVGLLAPLDAPHHLRKQEKLAYREGAVMNKDASNYPAAPDDESVGCWVNCGIDAPVWVSGEDIPPATRVTVRLQGKIAGKPDEDDGDGFYRGVAVDPREPTLKLGLYWGYQTRIATTLRAAFEECAYEGGYDLTIGTSERGETLGMSKIAKFKHLLIVFGGVGGLEDAVVDGTSGYETATAPSELFNRYMNVCPNQTSRTIRTEEALMITLAALSPHLPER